MDQPERNPDEKLADVRELCDKLQEKTNYDAYVEDCRKEGVEPASPDEFVTRPPDEEGVGPMWGDDLSEYPNEESRGEMEGVRYRTGPALSNALIAAQHEVETIGFDGTNKGQDYKYATGSAIAVYTRTILAKHGLAIRRIRHVIVDEHSMLWVRSLYQLSHEPSGQSEPPEWFQVPLVSGHGRSLDKAMGAALSFGDKYYRQGLLGLDWKGEDDVDGRVDQKSNRGGRQQQQAPPQRETTRKASKQLPPKRTPPKGGNNPQYQERVLAARAALQNSRLGQNNAIRWATGLTDLNEWPPGFAPASVYIAVTDFCVLYRKRNEESGLKIDSHDQYLAEIADEDQSPLWLRGKPQERALTFDKTLPPNKA